MAEEEVRRLFDPQYVPEEIPEELRQYLRPTQAWTVTGYPIVEGRYIDLAAGEVKSVQRGEQTTNGPPTIGVYWHNISVGDCTLYRGMRGGFVDGGVGEFVTRLGKFLENGFCELASLNVSTYSVTVIIETQKSRDEIMRKQYDCGLIASPPSPRPPCAKHCVIGHGQRDGEGNVG